MAPSLFSEASSPFSGAPATVRLRVSVDSPFAEVFLINHEFALVKRSIGNLDEKVEPGVYTVKARLGDETVEQLVVLSGDKDLDLAGRLPVASPVPLEGTSRTHEFQRDFAVSASVKIEPSSGSGAEIFLMARRWSSKAPPADLQFAASWTAPELSLLKPDGGVVINLTKSGAGRGQGWDPFLGQTVSVDPGVYFLRWQNGVDVLVEQSLQAVRGWQTQVFLLDDPIGEADPDGRRVSVLMARAGFRPDNAELLRIEEARLVLADERKVVSERVDEWLSAKFDNPMLGLYGAHLMLIAREAEQKDEKRRRRGTEGRRLRAPVRFDQNLFDEVVRNLVSLLGPDHPDAVALSTQATGQQLDALPPPTAPPMLWRSWLLLIEASNVCPQLVPVAVWRRAFRLLPIRPFLVWCPEEGDTKAGEAWRNDVARLLGNAPPANRPMRAHESGATLESVSAGPSPDEARRNLSLQLLAPRALIDELANAPAPEQAIVSRPSSSARAKGNGSTRENMHHYCLCISSNKQNTNSKAALIQAAGWNSGDVIRIRFLDGDQSLRQRVRAVAEEWTAPGMANLRFAWVKSGPADIRIAFDQSNGSWSYLGNLCRQIPEPQATMNYGWLTPASNDTELRRVVLHEFGHALGLSHEYQSPPGGVRLNIPAVIAELTGPPHNWDVATIERNVIAPYRSDLAATAPADPDSIVTYPIPSAWTLDGFSMGFNRDLSQDDIQVIRQSYPA